MSHLEVLYRLKASKLNLFSPLSQPIPTRPAPPLRLLISKNCMTIHPTAQTRNSVSSLTLPPPFYVTSKLFLKVEISTFFISLESFMSLHHTATNHSEATTTVAWSVSSASQLSPGQSHVPSDH